MLTNIFSRTLKLQFVIKVCKHPHFRRVSYLERDTRTAVFLKLCYM